MSTAEKKILERFSLAGRTALVTGGASGIGLAYCHAMGEAGAKVAVVDINQEAADTAVENLTAKNIEAIAIKADVTDEAEVKNMVARVIDTWGSLTIGVNNAGIGMWKDSTEMEFADWKTVIDLNLNAVYLCAKHEALAMKAAEYGKIVNTASMSAHISNTPQNQAAYNASKAGVLHLTRSLAAEWAPMGIRVNSISPGYTKTLLVDKLLATPEGQSILPRWLEKIPLGRMATTDDLQGAICYLAAEVSDYMTGSDMLIDGGYCAW